jgi:hypothetical protein
MGYAIVQSACFGCGRVFGYNPHRVPSIRVNADRQPDPQGEREPVCRTCIETANRSREAHGLPLLAIPEGAYEGFPEEEL